jgi:uncharacterized protein involved in outer membrane biogenesis
MRLRRIALWSAGGVLLLLATGFCWLWFSDLGFLKPQLERWVIAATDRDFAIEGRFEIDLGRETIIVAEGIRLENADWSTAQDMASIEYLELHIDTSSLFNAPLTIGLVKIRNAEIRLERSESEGPNWDFGIAEDRPDQEAEGDALNFIVSQSDIDRVHIVFESPERTGPVDFKIGTLKQQHRPDGFLELSLDAELGQRNFDLQAIVGTRDALLLQRNIEYEIEGRLDTFNFSSKGTIDDLVAPSRPSLVFTASAPDINDLLSLFKLEESGHGDIDINGSLKPTEGGPLVLDVQGRLGQARIDANGTLSDLQNLQQFDASVEASGPDLGQILALFGFQQTGGAPFTIDIDANRDRSMLVIERAHLEFANAEFDLQARLPGFPHLDEGTVRLQITGSDYTHLRKLLRLPGAASGAFSVGLRLDTDPDGEEIIQVVLNSTLGNVEASGRIAPEPNYVGSEFDITVRSDSLAQLGDAYGLDWLPELPATIGGSVMVEENALRMHGPLRIEIEDIGVQLEGLVKLVPGGRGSQLTFGVSGPELANLVGMFAPSEQVPPLPFDLGGQVLIQSDGFRFRNARGTLGRSTVAIEGVLKPVKLLAGSGFEFAASGPVFKELFAHLPDLEVLSGAYSLSGELAFGADSIHFKDIELSREHGGAELDVILGLPPTTRRIDFDVNARGPNLHSWLTTLGDFSVANAPFSIVSRGELRDMRLTLEQLNIEIGEASVKAQGELDLARSGRSTEFEFDLNVPSLGTVGLLNERRMLEQSLQINAKVRGDENEVWIDELVARLGESDIRGSVRLQKGDIPKLSLEIQADTIRLAPLLEEKAPDYDATPEFDDGRLIPNIEVPFDAMKQLDASVLLDIDELQRDPLLLRAVKLRAQLQEGALYVHEAGFEASSGWLQARGALEPGDGLGKASLAIKARDLSLGLADQGASPSKRTDIDGQLEATGADLRALAGNANGALLFDARNFIVPENRLLKRIYGDIVDEIIGTINPFSKDDPETKIECIVMPIEISNGDLGFTPKALIRTDKIRILSDASVDLKSETIKISFETTPRRGLTISAAELLNPYVMVVGTLAAPRLAVDAKGGLITGGAAVATGGLSILAKAAWDRLARSKDPCNAAAKEGIAALQDRLSDLPTVTPSTD